MNTLQLFFTYMFTANIVFILLSGVQETVNYPIEQGLGLRKLWLFKLPHIIFWGIIAKLINTILPINSFFLPVFMLFYLLIRFIEYKGIHKESEKPHTEDSEADRALVDPVVIVPILIAGYIDMSVLDLITVYLGLWLGLGLAVILILSVRSKIELLQKRNTSVLLISYAVLSMVFSSMHYIINP